MKPRFIQETDLSELERRPKMRPKEALRRSTIIWLLIPLLVALGCTTRVPPSPPKPPKDILAQLGTIGVVSGKFTPETKAVVVPAGEGKSAAALKAAGGALGLGIGAAVMAAAAGHGACFIGYGPGCVGFPLVAALATAITPFMTVYAAREAAADVDSYEWAPEALEEIEGQGQPLLTDAFHQRNIQELLRDHVVREGRDKTSHPIVRVKDEGPETLDQKVDYRHLTSRGIDTVLEVSMTKVGFIKSNSARKQNTMI